MYLEVKPDGVVDPAACSSKRQRTDIFVKLERDNSNMMTEDKADAVALVTGDTINSHKDLEKYSGSGVLKPCISSLWLDDHDLRVGLCFKDVDELKKAVDWYSINRQKECVVQETGEDECM